MPLRVSWFERRTRGLERRAQSASPSFAEFYANHAPAVLRYFSRHTHDVHRAFDLTAETFAKAYEKRDDFRGSSELQASAWLWSIARNELALFRRRHAVEFAALARLGLERPQPSDEELRQVEELTAIEEARGGVRRAIELLPDDQRLVIEMRFVQHLSYDDIAARLKVSNDVVRARCSRGLRTLRADQRLAEASRALKG
jgi:RNA polymerase sigma-70 factor (ECF subfamily)